MICSGTFNFSFKTRRSSVSTTSPVIKSRSASTSGNTSTLKPRVAKALTRKLVSANTFMKSLERHLHRLAVLEILQMEEFYFVFAETIQWTADGVKPHGPAHFWGDRFASLPVREVYRGLYQYG